MGVGAHRSRETDHDADRILQGIPARHLEDEWSVGWSPGAFSHLRFMADDGPPVLSACGRPWLPWRGIEDPCRSEDPWDIGA